jgi:5-methylthioadenosine/S-adenosylhomocysteine deaminase
MDRGSIVYPPHEVCFMAGLSDDLKAWLDKPASAAYAGDGTATVQLMARLSGDFDRHPRIKLCYGPAGPQWVSDEMWRLIARDAAERGLGIHFHALESPAQRQTVRQLYPDGLFLHLEQLGAMNSRTVVAHGVWVTDSEMELLARVGATVVRNPGSNIRLRSGIAPLARYIKHGVRVAIGTDNCAVKDDEDLLSELRLAGLLAREPDWNAPPPPDVKALLAMATTNGAVAAQRADEIGVIAPGKLADVTAFSLRRTHYPWLDPDMPLMDAFMARAEGADVRLTMVDGRILYYDGQFADPDLADVEVAAAASASRARLPSDLSNRDRTASLLTHLAKHYRSLAAKPATPEHQE